MLQSQLRQLGAWLTETNATMQVLFKLSTPEIDNEAALRYQCCSAGVGHSGYRCAIGLVLQVSGNVCNATRQADLKNKACMFIYKVAQYRLRFV